MLLKLTFKLALKRGIILIFSKVNKGITGIWVWIRLRNTWVRVIIISVIWRNLIFSISLIRADILSIRNISFRTNSLSSLIRTV